jgi:hypothetical protein
MTVASVTTRIRQIPAEVPLALRMTSPSRVP